MNFKFTPERIMRFILVIIGLAFVGWLLWLFRDLVLYLTIGVVLAYLLRPLVIWLQGFGMNRVSAVSISFLIGFGTLIFFVATLIPNVAERILALVNLFYDGGGIGTISTAITSLMLELDMPIDSVSFKTGIQENLEKLINLQSITDAVNLISFKSIAGIAEVFAKIFYAIIVIPFVTFFFLKDGPMIRDRLFRLVPNQYFEITLSVIDKVETNIGQYFKGITAQAALIATVASIGLWFAGLEEWLTVGIFTGIANTIPYFGPILGFLAGTLVGVVQTGDFELVPGVLFTMLLTQFSDNILFQPLIFSRVAQMHPLVILLVVLVGAKVAGIAGMLVAIPLAAVLKVSAEQILWSLRNYYIFGVSQK